jgi:hypothetical protein
MVVKSVKPLWIIGNAFNLCPIKMLRGVIDFNIYKYKTYRHNPVHGKSAPIKL